MNANMAKGARAYSTTLLTLCAVLPFIAYWYSNQQHIPSTVALWFTLAAMAELAFYISPGFAWSRALWESVAPAPVRSLVLVLTAIAPYLIYAFGTGTFHLRSLGLLALLATIVAAWFAVESGKSIWVDLLFAGFIALVYMSKIFDDIYVTLAKQAPAAVLGQLMWVRTSALAVITIRKLGGINYEFYPSLRDWIIGVLLFAICLPIAFPAAIAIHFAQPHWPHGTWTQVALKAIGTFAGIFWVVAFLEEFLFRGMLLQLMTKHWGTIIGFSIATAIFALAHLPFAHHFPNWRMTAMAGLLGIVYGIGYLRTRSIRAPMVAHALVVTTWRLFF